MRRTVTAAFVVCLLLASCSYEAVTLIADPYWWTIQNVERDLRRELAGAARNMGYRLRVVVLERDAEGMVSMAAVPLDAASGTVILSPLLTASQETVVQRHPDRRFILLGATRKDYPENALPVIYDRATAYGEAGRTAARLAQKAGANGVRTPASAIAYVGSVSRQNELTAFVDAFSKEASSGLLHVCRLYDLDDRERARTCLRDAEARGAAIYLVSAAVQNGFVLEELRGRDVSVIAESHSLAPAFPETVAYSVEIDVVAAVRAGLRGLTTPTKEPAVIPAHLVVVGSTRSEPTEEANSVEQATQ
jgi:hypothetical protein